MSLKTAIAAVLKATRRARGLSQKDLAEVSSRTYVSKLERAQSSPTLEMMTTLSGPLNISPLTLVALTLGAETGRTIRSLISCVESEVTDLIRAGVLSELQIPFDPKQAMNQPTHDVSKAQKLHMASHQSEFCFAD